MGFCIPIAFFDTPPVIDTAITPIPAVSAQPLQVIASTGVNVGVGINYNDTTGEFIGVYIGQPGREVLVCIIGNGISSQAWGPFPQYSRVSIKNVKNKAITFGLLQGVIVSV